MGTWQGALVRADSTVRLREALERCGIVASELSGPWVLINVEPQYGKLGPPPFARDLSKTLQTSVIAFFLQTTVANERIEQWENGELLRELEYYQDGGGWISQRGAPQAWEGDYFFSEDEGTGDAETWPSNLSDEASSGDIARYEEARAKRTPGPVMDLLMGGSMPRLCKFHGVDPNRPGGYYKARPNWRIGGTLIALGLFFVSACILGYVYR